MHTTQQPEPRHGACTARSARRSTATYRGGMINGVHTIIYSDDAPVTRAFLRDVLGWSSIDGGEGWLIFETPATEMGVHPTRGDGGEEWATTPHHDRVHLPSA